MSSEDHLQLNLWRGGSLKAFKAENLDLPKLAVAFRCEEVIRFLVVGKRSIGLGWIRIVISNQVSVRQEIVH